MRTLVFSAGALCLTLMAGCGWGRSPMKVWGTVTYAGKPVEKGTLRLLPMPGSPEGTATEGDIVNGSYVIPAKDGPLSGLTYKVEIRALHKAGTVTNPFNPTGPPLDRFDNFIPAAYNHKSTLTISVAAHESGNKHDFDLKEE